MAKKTYEKHISPAGIAKYPWITKADAKFDKSGDGHYKVTLVLPSDSPEAQEFSKKITAAAEAAKQELIKENPKKKAYGLYVPFRKEMDEDGNETGNTEFLFKTKAVVRMEGKEPWVKKITCFDAKKKPLVNPKIGSGSEIKCRFEFNPLMVDASKSMGVGLRFDAVMVKKLVEFSGSADASGFEVEDGYEAPEGTPEGEPAAAQGDTGGDF